MECLHSLANTDCFGILQDKLNNWRIEFQSNCTEANISRCCELLELNAKIQTQLFKLLGLCAIQGNFKGPESKIKKRMLPFLGEEYIYNGLTSNIVMDILSDISRETSKFNSKSIDGHMPCSRQRNCSKERKRSNCRKSSDSIVLESENDNHARASPQEISNRLDKLKDMILDMSVAKKKAPLKHKKKRQTSLSRSQSYPSFCNPEDQINTVETMDQIDRQSDDLSCNTIDEIRNDTYLQGVVGQYNDLFSESRVHSMEVLRQHGDDHENNQRILFALVMTAAKNVAELQRSLRKPYGSKDMNSQKSEFRKPVTRSILKSLRARIIYELINNRGSYFQFHLPHKFLFVEMEDFIDRTIELFWKFGGVSNGLQLSEAADGELFDEHKYRRSYDSDFNAPLVSHHIWPSLIQGRIILVKGEACTRASNKMAGNRNICSTNNPSQKKHGSK